MSAAPGGFTWGRRTGLFLDFDGVLADIVDDPSMARPRPGLPDLVATLRSRLGRVAIVTGRPVSYVAPLVPARIDVVGLYGLERQLAGDLHVRPEAARWRPVVAEVEADATERFGPGVVEPKGLSLTVHYREDASLAAPMRVWAREQSARTGLEYRPAKRSFELHPPIACDKGTVVTELASGLEAVAYLGDDLGDLPAFDALDRLAEAGIEVLRVAVDSDEAPPVLLRRADLVVDGPPGAEQFLRAVLAHLDDPPSLEIRTGRAGV
ncbi:MAG: trehalose-phosphatase [Acidimicrobiales bacterium]